MITANVTFKQWVKTSSHPLARNLCRNFKRLRSFEIPAPKYICTLFYQAHRSASALCSTGARILWWTPLFKSRCQHVGKGLFLYGGLPYLAGPLSISIGEQCRISGRTTLSGRSTARTRPQLSIGNNVDLGWQTTVAVGTRIELGDNVRIAGQCFLAGYPGHPVNAQKRAAGEPESDHQARDIVLERDVWLGTGVTVLAGVRIGRGTIVSAGSLVCKNLPAGVIAAGNPARVVKTLGAEAGL